MTALDIEREYADEQVALDWAKRQDAALWGVTNTISVHDCHVDNIERVQKAREKLHKVAARHAQPRPVVLFSPTQFVSTFRTSEWIDGEEVYRVRKVTQVKMVVIAPPVLGFAGWRLVAVKTLVGGEGIVATLPGEEAPRYFYNGSSYCSHCDTNRKRNEVFIVHHEATGVMVQVGRQCLREYTGIDPDLPLAAAAFYEATGRASEGSRYEEDLTQWLPWVALAVRIDGRYWSRRSAEDATSASYESEGSYGARMIQQRPTVEHVRVLQNERINQPDMPEPQDEDRALAAEVVKYVGTLDASMSAYHANLQAVYRSGIVLWKHQGLIASAFAGYLNEQKKLAEAKLTQVQRPSEWLGNQGDKVVRVPCRVLGCTESDGAYGVTYIYRFVTPEGDKITWFSSNDKDLTSGQEVALSGTIKALEVYRDEKKTVLTRCKVEGR